MISFAELGDRVGALADGLRRVGVRPGHRVALLVPPGIDLTAAVYACWQAGAVIVVADAGLGWRRMADALRSAAPDYLIGIPAAVAAAAAFRLPGMRLVVGELPQADPPAAGSRALDRRASNERESPYAAFGHPDRSHRP